MLAHLDVYPGVRPAESQEAVGVPLVDAVATAAVLDFSRKERQGRLRVGQLVRRGEHGLLLLPLGRRPRFIVVAVAITPNVPLLGPLQFFLEPPHGPLHLPRSAVLLPGVPPHQRAQQPSRRRVRIRRRAVQAVVRRHRRRRGRQAGRAERGLGRGEGERRALPDRLARRREGRRRREEERPGLDRREDLPPGGPVGGVPVTVPPRGGTRHVRGD
mmetsp:Transcript_226/g.583  ORF Transcript_226/g.583 Transcript_226/m.583 type:complete len:215 (+) Transcript_226:1625-2269(+)